MSDVALDQQKKAQNGGSGGADLGPIGKSSNTGSMQGGTKKSSGIVGDPGYGELQGAGDEAANKAAVADLKVDYTNVQVDRSRVGDLVKDIDTHTAVVKQAEKDDDSIEGRFQPLATNIGTKTSLQIFDNKLDVAAVDTTSFGIQYRNATTDYKRLLAEGAEYTSLTGKGGGDPLATIGGELDKKGGDFALGEAQVGKDRFRAARANLNTASKKMNGQLQSTRGAANSFQAAVHRAQAKAAAAEGAEAIAKLAEVRAEIREVAEGVGRVVKVVSAVAGLAGGGGAVNGLATAAANKTEGGQVEIEGGISGLRKGGSVEVEAESNKLEIMKSMGEDGKEIKGAAMGEGGGGLAEQLVTAIGNYANKEKIAKLQIAITEAGKKESTFNAAADAEAMVGAQATLEAEAGKLQLLITTFFTAKQEMAAARDALMATLSKGGGKKGKDQSRAVLFLSDSDRFLAQVTVAISVGKNQQDNLTQAVSDRKKLRGTVPGLEGGGEDLMGQSYFRCYKTVVPHWYGDKNMYRLEKVYVKFTDNGMVGPNSANQGGSGTIEGTGGAGDEVANKLDILQKAKKQVTELQTAAQNALGMGPAGLNA